MNPGSDLGAAEAVYVLSCREVVCGSNLPYVSLIPRLLLPAAGFHLLSGVQKLVLVGSRTCHGWVSRKRVEKGCYELWLDRHPKQ